MKQILVDEDRYNALESLYEVLRYQSEINEEINIHCIYDLIFELSKNTSVLGPSKDLIQRYEHLAKIELLFRCALAEISNMNGEATIKAKQVLDERYKNR